MQDYNKITIRNFLYYKFFNSFFLGLSIGSIFILYTPLEPSVYSLGGVVLAFGMLLVAKIYHKILTIDYFFKISLFVEFILFLVIIYFLIFSYSYITSLMIYIGYQFTFLFGSYLIRAETLFLSKRFILSKLDIFKQSGYLFGMGFAFILYKVFEYFSISDKQIQVYNLHFLLLIIEIIVILFLIKSFKKRYVQ